ncbi:alkyl hydroperoxide reductase [Elizabethkingia anophelis]|uniref:alkyl hydroperoxide reductase n=1 Tax=Elizabethkingia anophelis TaxID=1117645 RepID=UPI003891464E
MKDILVFFCLILFYNIDCQVIEMYFPKFSNKKYDFIIFQGNEQIIITQGTIPLDGKFYLEIPKKNSPYIGMARWLITGTKEGGGIDIFIPGKNFSISCLELFPNKNNIIFSNNNENQLLNSLYEDQMFIYNRYAIMRGVLKIYGKNDENYDIYNKEYLYQKKKFENFHMILMQRNDYLGHLIQFINLVNGIGIKLDEDDIEKAKIMEKYISEDLDWKDLFTSGYWYRILNNWIYIHTRILKDMDFFVVSFKKIRSRLDSTKYYKYFEESVRKQLEQQEKYDYFEKIHK